MYEFFLGQRVAYPFVEKYVKNNWSKFGLVKSMTTKVDTGCEDYDGGRVFLFRASYDRAIVELRVDVKLKDTIMVVVPKVMGNGYHMRTIRVEYEWTPPRCSSCNVFGHVLDECSKQHVMDVLKNLKNPKQVARGVSFGPKEESEDDDGVLDKLSLELRMGFLCMFSAGSGSVCPIRRTQVWIRRIEGLRWIRRIHFMDMAYPSLQFLVILVLVVKTKP
nr:hypothetical protein [Tanacetum cinerariifolium]